MQNHKKMLIKIGLAVLLVVVLGSLVMAAFNSVNTPEKALETYFKAVNSRDYGKMYLLISDDVKKTVTREAFIERNQNIYEGIEARNVTPEVMSVEKVNGQARQVYYNLSMDTVAGKITNPANIRAKKDWIFGEYRLMWNSAMILPGLGESSKVRVETIPAERARILDMDGVMLAGKGMVPAVGFVPGKMNGETQEADIAKTAELLGVQPESIKNALSESWVEADVFVPIKTMTQLPVELEEALLQIPGILIGEGEERLYPFGDKAKEAVGYLGGITKEELEAFKDDPHYRDTSVVGKAGYEKTYDQTLRGMDGGSIYVKDSADGKTSERLVAQSQPVPGTDVNVPILAAQFQ